MDKTVHKEPELVAKPPLTEVQVAALRTVKQKVRELLDQLLKKNHPALEDLIRITLTPNLTLDLRAMVPELPEQPLPPSPKP